MSPDASAMQNVWPSTRVTWRGPPETDAGGNRFSHGDDSNVMSLLFRFSCAFRCLYDTRRAPERCGGQPQAAPSTELDGAGSGRRIIRNEFSSPRRPARIG